MKRFRSNLQNVHALCRQQRRMAELELASAAQRLTLARETEQQARRLETQAHEDVARSVRAGLGIAGILAARTNLQRAEERAVAAQSAAQQAQRDWDVERDRCREISSREERLAELISRQRQEHRREVFRQQQIVMDENAAARGQRSEGLRSEVNSHA